MARKTYNEKLHINGDLPKIEDFSDNPECCAKYGAKMLVAEPMQYNDVMEKIPKGKVTTIVEIRDFLAKRAGADFTCWLTGGMFQNLVANAAAERDDDLPWWRTLKKDGELSDKYPGGVETQKKLLEAEGHKVVQKGKRFFVADYEKALAKL